MRCFVLGCLAAVHVLACYHAVAAGADLFEAVRAGESEKVEALLKADPSLVEARTEDDSTALHLAALEGHAEIARVLLAGGAHVNARGLREETPLHMAAYDGHREVAEVLLASQADVNARNTAGAAPLHIAARKGHRDFGALLLDHRANVNVADNEGATPLHAAAAAGHKEMVELLLSRNADILALDKAGRTAKAIAAEKQHVQIVEVLTPRVGDFYSLERLEFEGVTTFSAKVLRQALKDAPGFADGTHPLAPLDELLQAIQRKLLLGYQHHGFPAAQVAARQDVKAGRIVAKVVEGPRYTCGEVKVSGAQKAEVEDIVRRLTVSRPAAASALQAFEFKDKAPGVNPLIPSPADETKPQPAPWLKGEGAPFSELDARQMRKQVIDALHEQGFLLAKADVRVVPDSTNRTAELQVDLFSEGPRAVIRRIDLAGNKKNSTEAVLRYLDLKPGIELSSKVIGTVQDRLWRAARFLTNSVSIGLPDSEGRVVVRIEVAEYENASPLGQEFSSEEQCMLGLRDWLAKLDQNQDELVVKVSGLPNEVGSLEVVLSPQQGLLALAQSAQGKGASKDQYGLTFTPGQAGLYAPVSGRKLVLPTPKAQLLVSVAYKGVARATDNLNLTAMVGFATKPEDVPEAPLFRFELSLDPFVCVALVHRWDCSSWFDGDTLIRSNATMLLKVNARTGRLAEFRYIDAESGQTVSLQCEPKVFAPNLRRLEAAAAAMRDTGDTNAPFSSAAAFLIEEALSSKYLEPHLRTNNSFTKVAGLPALLRSLKLERVLAPLNRLWGTNSNAIHRLDEFVVPLDPDAAPRTMSGMVAMCADWVLRKNDDLFPPHSWPWTLLREACFVVQGRSRYSEAALREAGESAETGPLGCLVLAEVLSRFMPELGRETAAHGLERLSAADLRHDLGLLLTGDSIVSQCCRALALGLRDMNDAQLGEVVKERPAAIADFLRDCRQRLRASPEQPVFEAVVPALDTLWEQGFKGEVVAALEAHLVDPAQAFKDGLAAYRNALGDKSEAAKLFLRAASHGHPGAQYFLGMMYEKGEGVPKDVKVALRYYTQSATGGYNEAAATLGNFYNDGIVVKQDYAEAFVWFSVAAARHHRLGAVLRNSAQRRLTPQELAEARKRVAALLEAMPSIQEMPLPPDVDR